MKKRSPSPLRICFSAALFCIAAFSAFLTETAHARENLQCVPYAREVSGIQIYGDAHSWWEKAAGRYARGNTPAVGSVLSLRSHRRMRLGHVAAVSKIIDNRTILLNHANWSLINGRRGQIERGAKAVDVSPKNDWSQVKVWYAPINALGGTVYPANGFIYGKGKEPGAGKPEAPRSEWRQTQRHWTNAKGKRQATQPRRHKTVHAPTDLVGDIFNSSDR